MTNTFKLNKELIEELPSSLNNKIDLNLINSPYTTSRILEIPQNIDLRFENGTLVLKEGSKVYNGLGDTYTISSDITKTGLADGDVQQYLLLKSDGVTLVSVGVSDSTFSYNSSTGFIHSDTHGDFYLPIALTSHNTSSGEYTSIDNVFNGIGFFRQYLIIYPGIKIQLCTEVNNVGTHNCQIIDNQGISMIDETGWGTSEGYYYIQYHNSNYFQIQPVSRYDPSSSDYMWRINNGVCQLKQNNIWYNSPATIVGIISRNSSLITSLKTGEVDSILETNAQNLSKLGKICVSGLSKPSAVYVNLTLGSSGTTYRAPFNGWISWREIGSASNQYHIIECNRVRVRGYAPTNGTGTEIYFPVARGDTFTVIYSTTSRDWFRIHYDKGEV